MQHSFCSFLLRLGHFLSAILSSVCCRTRPQWSFSCKIIFMSWNISKSIMRNNVRVLSASTCKRELAKHATSSVCVCACVYVHRFTTKASSVWKSWNVREDQRCCVENVSFLCHVSSLLLLDEALSLSD